MTNMAKELRKKSSEELTELIIKCKEQLLQIRFNIANGEAEKTHVINELKKTIARSFTILNERTTIAEKSEDKKTTSSKKTSTSKSTKKASAKKGSKK